MINNLHINNIQYLNQSFKNIIHSNNKFAAISMSEKILNFFKFNQSVNPGIIKLYDLSLKINLEALIGKPEIHLINLFNLYRVIKKVHLIFPRKISVLELNLLKSALKKFTDLFQLAVQEFSKVDVSELTVEDIYLLDYIKIRQLSLQQIQSLRDWHIQALSNDQLGWFTLHQFTAFSSRQITSLIPNQIHALSHRKVGYMKPIQIQALTEGHIKELSPEQIYALNLRYLSCNQLFMLINLKYNLIPPDKYKTLSTHQVNEILKAKDDFLNQVIFHLSPSQFLKISVSDFPDSLIAYLPVEKFKEFLPQQIAQFNQLQTEKICINKIKCLALNQLQAFTEQQKKWMSENTLKALAERQRDLWKIEMVRLIEKV